MRYLRSFCIAFSMYSRIPMPQFEWKEEDMRYTLIFFPFVGLVIGLLLYLWGIFCINHSVNSICYSLITSSIPLIVSGGFHIDGFMDTEDAFHSYQGKEKKLEILKDPHIGAFSVIYLLLYYLIFIAAISEICDMESLLLLAVVFPYSRCLSALSLLFFQKAKKTGSLNVFSDSADKKAVSFILLLQCFIYFSFLLSISIGKAIGMMSLFIVLLVFYYHKTQKEFGGITGDTAGWFVTVTEGALAVFLAFCNLLA